MFDQPPLEANQPLDQVVFEVREAGNRFDIELLEQPSEGQLRETADKFWAELGASP